MEKLESINQTHQGIVAEILLPTLPNQDGLMQHINKLEKTA
jgi:23S rRNA (guanosine2251-2'-O)-methyltransferase